MYYNMHMCFTEGTKIIFSRESVIQLRKVVVSGGCKQKYANMWNVYEEQNIEETAGFVCKNVR